MPDPQDLMHHLSNDVFRAVRTGWYRHEAGDGRNPTFRVLGTGTYHQPDISWEAAKIISEAQPALGIHRPHAILIDKIMHDNLMEEIPEAHMNNWMNAIESRVRINTLWYRNEAKGNSYWRPNPSLPASVPQTGLKLTRRLLQARLITAATEAQHQQLLAEREAARADQRPSAPELIISALQKAQSCE